MEEGWFSQFLVPTLSNLSLQFPVFLVLLVGIILAAMRRREAPIRYGLVLAALLLHLLLGVVGTITNSVLPQLLIDRGYTSSSLGLILGAVALVSTLGHAVGYILLLVALFWRRSLEGPGLGAGPQPEKPTTF